MWFSSLQSYRISQPWWITCLFYPIALKKAKIIYNFGLSECNRVKDKYSLCRNVGFMTLLCQYLCELGHFFDEIVVSLDCCIIEL